MVRKDERIFSGGWCGVGRHFFWKAKKKKNPNERALKY